MNCSFIRVKTFHQNNNLKKFFGIRKYFLNVDDKTFNIYSR